MNLRNLFDNVALILAVAACVMRFFDRAYRSNLLASLSFFASIVGQWVAHRRAAPRRAEAGAID